MSISFGTIAFVLSGLLLVFAVVTAVIYKIVNHFHQFGFCRLYHWGLLVGGACFVIWIGLLILSLSLSPSSLLNEKVDESYVIDTEYPYSIEVSGKRWLINGQTSQNKVITFESKEKAIEYIPSAEVKIEKCKATERYSKEWNLFGKQIEIYDDIGNHIFYRIYAPETAVKETVVIK